MAKLIRSKLNHLLSHWPASTVAACSWLHTQGYSYALLSQYRKHGWIKSIGNGAVVRKGDKVDWSGGLYAIQTNLKLPIYVGGKSALMLKGHGHFIPQGKDWRLFLYGPPNTKMPTWFKKYAWNVELCFISTNLFSDAPELCLSTHDMGSYSIRIASLERAMLELLSLVPQEQSFEEAKLLMEGLSTLRPQAVQELLEVCNSIKAKRLFLFLAEACNHEWIKKINFLTIDLGNGKRVIEKNGVLDSKYNITVPKVLKINRNETKS